MNKWWDILPLNSDGTGNNISVNWSNHFKGLYETKEIPHLVLKLADNHLRNLYFHNILKHGGNHYLTSIMKNWRSYRIKIDASVRKASHASQLMEIKSDTKARRDAGSQE